MQNRLLGVMIIISVLSVGVVAGDSISYTTPSDSDNSTYKIRNYTYINFSISNSTSIFSMILSWNSSNITFSGIQLGYNLNMDNNTDDSSLRGSIITNASGVNCSSGVQGRVGGGCYFDGKSSYINLSRVTYSGGASAGRFFTFELWIKPANMSNNTYVIAARPGSDASGQPDDGLNNNFNLSIINSSLVAEYGGSRCPATQNSISTKLNDDQWTHIAVTHDNGVGAQNIYLNGTLIQTCDFTSNPGFRGMFIGYDSYGGVQKNFYHGLMDEIRMWNYTRSNSEINNSMYMGFGRYSVNSTNLKVGNYTYYGWMNFTNGTQYSTPIRNFIIGNNPPNATQINITPKPVTITDSLTCSYGFIDADSDSESGTTFRWFNDSGLMNMTGATLLTNQSIMSGNLSNNVNVTCEVRPKDALDFGNRINSSRVNIGDNTAPSITNATQSATTVNNGDVITFRVNLSDSASPIETVYMETEDPNMIKSNLSMSSQGPNTAGINVVFEKNYTTNSPIGQWYVKFWGADTNGNYNSTNNRNLTFTTKIAVTTGGGGGGSSQTIIILGNDSRPMLDFGIPNLDVTVFNTPSTPSRSLKIFNSGLVAFQGTLSISESLKPYLLVEACSLQTGKCSRDSVNIASQENYQLNLYFTFTAPVTQPISGTVSFIHQDGTNYQLPVTIDRFNTKILLYFGLFAMAYLAVSSLGGGINFFK